MTFTVDQANRSAIAYAGRPRKQEMYLGSPCFRGHRGWRYASCGTCVDCAKGRRPMPRDQISPAVHMVVSDWYFDEFGNRTRTVRGE